MTQAERDEEAKLVLELEEMRANGASLAEIGRMRTKEGFETFESSMPDEKRGGGEKDDGQVKHIEQV